MVAILASCGGRSEPGAGPAGESGADATPGRAAKAACAQVAATAHGELGLQLAAQKWSADARYVLFRVNRGYQPARRAVHVVVDATTHAMFTLDNTTQIEFAPDHKHLIAVADAALTVYDLATGAPVGAPMPIANVARFTADGRLAWAERVAAGYRIHLRQLTTGDERVLEGMPEAPRLQPAEHEIVKLDFDDRGHVIAYHGTALRAWQRHRPEPIVVIDKPLAADPQISSDGIAYAISGERDREFFQHIALTGEAPVPTVLRRDATCGRGALDKYSYFVRCAEDRYLVAAAKGGFCVWDTATGRAQARFRPFRDEYHCNAEIAWTGDNPPGGPYTYYALGSGKKIKQPRGFEPPYYDAPTEEDPAAPPEDFVPPEKLRQVRDTVVSPRGNLIAGALDDRATLWNAAGDLVWQAATPSEAVDLDFTPRGELVVGGYTGQAWRLDLATRRMQSIRFEACDMKLGAIAIAADGRAAAACHRGQGRVVLLEGVPEPLITTSDHGWHVSAPHSGSASTIAWQTDGRVHAWSLPDGKQRWTYATVIRGLSVTADGGKLATVTAAEDAPTPAAAQATAGAQAPAARFSLSIRDAANQALATAALPAEPRTIMLSPDGSQIALVGSEALGGADLEVTILETARATMIDQFRASAAAVAWDPTGKPRLAYWRAGPPAALVIRDVAARQDVDTRAGERVGDAVPEAIAWAPDGTRLAVLADRQVTLWEERCAPSTLSFAGAGAAELRSDGTVVSLGEPAAAAALIHPD